MLSHCTLNDNSSPQGGGADGSKLDNCTLTGNSASRWGGGAYNTGLTNCTLTGNISAGYGGGAYSGNLLNCLLMGNSATIAGGAVAYAKLTNCTLTANSAGQGGGSLSSTLNNCIIYYNNAPVSPNCDADTLNYSCTTPLPASGSGNIDAEPQLASASHISATSPCRGAGNAAYASGRDIDGEPWANPPSMGCDEFYAGAGTGSLAVSVGAAYTNVAAGFSVDLIGFIEGRVSSSRWEFGDGTVASNWPYAAHAWVAPGDYAVVLRAYNNSNPGGVSATVLVHVVTQPVHYVSANSTVPVSPYSSWATAAANIQDAVDAASVAGALVLVSNGVYSAGGRVVYGALTNRVAVTTPLVLQCVNGPAETVIEGNPTRGDSAVRCVYLANGATLSGFTLAAGATRFSGDLDQEQSGAGLWCASPSVVVSNCVLVGNLANAQGGGAYSGTLVDCTLTGNSAYGGGGGTYCATLNNCTLLTNSALDLTLSSSGGGALSSSLYNCTLVGNSASKNGGGASASTLRNCTLMGNEASGNGGGVDSCTLVRCTLIDNSAYCGGGASSGTLNNCTITGNFVSFCGGGVFYSTLYDCSLTGNSADIGAGAYGGTLNNCTLTGNSAFEQGGGAWNSQLNNCIIYYNNAPSASNYFSGFLSYCCAIPLAANGVSNITNAPSFINLAAGNLYLQSNSPCINAGNNAYSAGSSDLDGRQRIVNGTVDIGAYEFQGAGMGEFIGWLQQYGLPTDGSVDFVDTDGDGLNNWQEWKTGTNPNDALSVLKMASAIATNNPPGLILTWQSVSGITYFLQRGTNLTASPAFSTIQTDIAGQASTTSCMDITATNGGPYFYRVGVQ